MVAFRHLLKKCSDSHFNQNQEKNLKKLSLQGIAATVISQNYEKQIQYWDTLVSFILKFVVLQELYGPHVYKLILQ